MRPGSSATTYGDIDRARGHLAALQLVFSRTLSPADAHLAPIVMAACWGALTSVDNMHCRARIRSVVDYAQRLFAPRVKGLPAILKEQALNDKIHRMLDSYDRWLDYIEAARNVGREASTQARRADGEAARAA